MAGRHQGAGSSAGSARADLVLAGFRLLRFERGQWRLAAGRLAGPLARMARLQALSERAWQAAIARRDGDDDAGMRECGGRSCA